MIKKLLWILGVLVLLVVVVFEAAVAYTVYANNAADRAAAEFCATVGLGSDIELAAARAAGVSGLRVTGNAAAYQFRFQGGVFHAGVCHLAVSGGKVISARVQAEGD